MLVRCDQIATWPRIALHGLRDAEAAFGKAALGLAHSAESAPVIGPVFRATAAAMAPVDRFLDTHPIVKGAVIVGADVAGAIAGTVALITLATVGGTVLVVVGLAATFVAGLACFALLAADGAHLWYVAHNDEVGLARLEAQPWYQWVQAIGPLLTLPDLAIGGRSVVREATEASRKAAAVGSRIAAVGRSAAASSREFRETLADGDQSWEVIRAAAAVARRNATDQRRMAALAQRENKNLMMRRNAVVATVGGAWAARQFVHEKASDAHAEAERRLGVPPGSVALPGQAAHLLTPSVLAGSQRHLHITTLVVKRPRPA